MTDRPGKEPPKPLSLREADESIRKGNEAAKEGRYEEAYFAWKEALDIDPARAPVLDKGIRQLRARLVQAAFQEARAASEAGNHFGAALAFRKVLAYEPDDVATRFEANEGAEREEKAGRSRRRARALVEGGGILAAVLLIAWLVYRILQ